MRKICVFLILVTSLVISLFFFNGLSKVEAKKDNLNFLIVGLDKDYNVSRSDVIILANLNNKNDKLNLVSIPRDSLVSIPCGVKGTVNDKINHSYVYGESNWGSNKGIDCLVQTITRLFEIPILPYVIFDFEAVKKSVDVIGGVTIAPKMSFKAKDGSGRILEFKKGKQINLDGEGALAFIRHRASLPNQDLDRCNNQKDLLVAVMNKFNGFTRLEKIKYGIKLYSLINTNIKYDEIFELIKIDFNKYQPQTYTLKGKSIYDQGYYYILDKEYLKKMKYLIS